MIKINGKLINNEKFPNDEFKINGREIMDALDFKIKRMTINDGLDSFSTGYIPQNYIEFYYRGNESLIELMFVKNFIDNTYRKDIMDELHLILTYLPYSRMDRVKDAEDCFTLKYIGNFINSLNFYHVSVLEAHSNVSLGILNNAEQYLITPLILDKAVEDGLQFDCILYPDEGAGKRYNDLIPKTNVLTGSKKRDWKTGLIEGVKILGDIPNEPFDVVILDDLSSYGGSFYHSGKALKELGANKITLIVTHCENNIMYKGKKKIGLLCQEDNPIDRVITTNTILTESHDKITVYDINDLIEK